VPPNFAHDAGEYNNAYY